MSEFAPTLMRVITLKFQSILDLVDFQMATDTVRYAINRTALTLTGNFRDADVELAKSGFNAMILELSM